MLPETRSTRVFFISNINILGPCAENVSAPPNNRAYWFDISSCIIMHFISGSMAHKNRPFSHQHGDNQSVGFDAVCSVYNAKYFSRHDDN